MVFPKKYKHSQHTFISWIAIAFTTVAYCQQESTTMNSIVSATEGIQSLKTPTVDSSQHCGINGNTDTICSPKSGETWKNGTWYPITWNTMYPTYVSSPTLDIYIYFVQNYQNVLIKKLSDINTSKGTEPVLVDDTWRLNPSAETYESLVYIVPSGLDPEKLLGHRYSDYPPPVHNLVARKAAIVPPVTALPSNSSSSIMSSTMMNAPTNQIPMTPPPPPSASNISNLAVGGNSKQQHSQDSHTLQPGIIAAVVLACFAVLGACIAVFWVMRHSRRRKLVYGEKGHLQVNSTASSSMFPMNNVEGSREKLHFQNNSSSISIANPSAIHSQFSSDAAMSPPPFLMTGNSTTRLHGTAHTGSERGSLKSHTTPNTPTQATNKPSFGFMSVPSLPLMDDSSHNVYMLGSADNNRPQSTTSFSNASSRSEPPLTSTDALLIADTFRQRMRRPDWQQQQQQKQQEQGQKNEEEEDKRRQLSEALLKTELEAEGTLMKKVGKRAHLLPATYDNKRDVP